MIQPAGLTAFILADDLTGACDAAIPFASRKISTQVVFDPERMPQSEVLALDIASRGVTARTAKLRIKSALKLAQHYQPRLFFKKIDSVFRGNTFEEIKACLELLPQKFAILAPAYPMLGRWVHHGQLHALHLNDHSTLDLALQLREHGIKLQTFQPASGTTSQSLAEQMIHAKENGLRLILCDAETEQDLDAIAHAGLHSRLDLIWMGSAGLAHALARMQTSCPEARGPSPKIPGAIIFCMGSDHPVTLEQIRNLKQARDLAEIFPGPATGGDIRLALKKGIDILLRIDHTQSYVGRFHLREMREILRPNLRHPIGALVLSGGDTAAMVCDAFEARAIELRNELLPGIPWGVIRGGAADGLVVITKSGGFGAANALLRLANFPREEAKIYP